MPILKQHLKQKKKKRVFLVYKRYELKSIDFLVCFVTRAFSQIIQEFTELRMTPNELDIVEEEMSISRGVTN